MRTTHRCRYFSAHGRRDIFGALATATIVLQLHDQLKGLATPGDDTDLNLDEKRSPKAFPNMTE